MQRVTGRFELTYWQSMYWREKGVGPLEDLHMTFSKIWLVLS